MHGNADSFDPRLKAALWTLAGALFFSLMNACVKYLSVLEVDTTAAEQSIPVLQITFARYGIAALLMLPLLVVKPARFRMSSPAKYAIRTLSGFGGIVLMFVAVTVIPLASATAIGFTSPIFAMLFAALLLSERITRHQWFGAMIGLIGALIIAAPGPDLIAPGALIAFAAAACMGAEIVCVRWLAKTVDSDVTVLFYSNLFGVLLAGALMLPFLVWPTGLQALFLFLIGFTAIMGQGCFIRAARLADASFIAPFFYVSLFYAALIGYVIFEEIPTLAVLVGCTAILASALFLVRRRSDDPATAA